MASTRQTELLQELPGALAPAGASWLDRRREEAAATVRASGLPNRRVEEWRTTAPLARVTDTRFEAVASEPTEAAVASARASLSGDAVALSVDGRLVEGVTSDSVVVQTLAEVLAEDAAAIEPHLAAIAPAAYFSAMNAALFDQAIVVRARPGQRGAVRLEQVKSRSDRPSAAYPRLFVLVGRGAELDFQEIYRSADGEAQVLTNVVTEVRLEEGGGLTHTRVTYGAADSYHVGTLAASLDRYSRYDSQVFSFGGALTRLELDVALEGESAECSLEGVYHAEDGEHVEHYTRVDHRAPRCTSRENYRGVVDGSGHAVFDGIAYVRKDAHGTAAHQENRNLLLSERATVQTKPHLEIETDDVTCSHGATVGELDEQQLFYLRSRGICADQARAILIYSFLRELVGKIPSQSLSAEVGEAVIARLQDGAAVRALVGLDLHDLESV